MPATKQIDIRALSMVVRPEDPEAVKAQLFTAYEQANHELEEAHRHVEELLHKRSECVKAVRMFMRKNKFRYNGEAVMVVQRGDTWFFRRQSVDDLEDVSIKLN